MERADGTHPTYVLTMPNGTRFMIGKRPDKDVWFMSHITSSEPYKTVHLADFVDAKAAMAFIGYNTTASEKPKKKRRWF